MCVDRFDGLGAMLVALVLMQLHVFIYRDMEWCDCNRECIAHSIASEGLISCTCRRIMNYLCKYHLKWEG